MEKVNIMIIEDDLVLAASLNIMLTQLGYVTTGNYRSGTKALENFNNHMVDIVLLDIQLEDDLNGVDTAEEISERFDTPVIFLTGNNNERLRKKAINGKNVYQYIEKPFNKTEVQNAIELTLKIRKNEKQFQEQKQGSLSMDDALFLKTGTGFKKIHVKDIQYLEADGSYCILMQNNEKTLFSENLAHFEKKLSFNHNLMRIHRSYIINIQHIQRVHENRLWIGNTEIPIGKTYKDRLNSILRFI